MKRMLISLLLAALASACLDSANRVGKAEPAPVPSEPDPEPEPEPVEPPAVECSVKDLEVVVGFAESADPFDLPRPPLVVDSDVYLHRRETGYSNAANDIELFALDPVLGEERQVTANDQDDVLIDARDGAMLIRRGPWQDSQLVFLDGDRTLVLEPGAQPGPYTSYEPFRLVEPGRAVWTLRSDPEVGPHVISVRLLDGDEVKELWSAEEVSVAGPWLDDGRVAWSAWHVDRRDLYLWTPQTGTQQLTDDETFDGAPALTEDLLFWLRGSGVSVYHLATGETVELNEGSCSTPHVDAGRGLFSCAALPAQDEIAWYPYGPPNPTLYLYDDGVLIELANPPGVIASARLAGDLVAWVEYDDAEAGCYEPGPGRVMLSRAEAGWEPREIAAIGTGCMCCAMDWPPVMLAMGDRLIGWNYPIPEPLTDADYAPPWPGELPGVGWATVEPVIECIEVP